MMIGLKWRHSFNKQTFFMMIGRLGSQNGCGQIEINSRPARARSIATTQRDKGNKQRKIESNQRGKVNGKICNNFYVLTPCVDGVDSPYDSCEGGYVISIC